MVSQKENSKQSTSEQIYEDPSELPISSSSFNKYDPYSMKGAIDDELAAYMESKGFEEYNGTLNVKIIIHTIACFLGYYSHMKVPMPDQAWLLPFFIGGYALLMAVHYYIERYLEKDAFFWCESHKMSSPLKAFQQMKFVSVANTEDSNFTYELKVFMKDQNGNEKVLTSQYQFADFFDTYGYMHRDVVKENIIEDVFKQMTKAAA